MDHPDASWAAEVDEIRRRIDRAHGMGGPARIARQHEQHRKTIRERVNLLVDANTFDEIGVLAGGEADLGEGPEFVPDNFVAGLATVDGQPVCVCGEDATLAGGTSIIKLMGSKRERIQEIAESYRLPLIWLVQGGGASVRAYSRSGAPDMPQGQPWGRLVRLSAQVPLATAVLGPSAGFHAGLAALAHFTVMARGTSQIFASGPPVVNRSLGGTNFSSEEIGGAEIHEYESGVVDQAGDTEEEAIDFVRQFISFMPANCGELPFRKTTTDDPQRYVPELQTAIPRNRKRAYDVRSILKQVVDRDSTILDLQPYCGRSVVTCLSRINGCVVGIIANDCRHKAGSLDGAAADKLCHFVQLCDNFNIPLIFFVDTPGVTVGPAAERSGALQRAARAVYSIQQARVPQFSIVLRKVYGLGGGLMGSGPGLVRRVAWPSGEWGSIPIEGGVAAAFGRRISEVDPAEIEALENDLRASRSPFVGAEKFTVENLIDPGDTRRVLVRFLEHSWRQLESARGGSTWRGVMP